MSRSNKWRCVSEGVLIGLGYDLDTVTQGRYESTECGNAQRQLHAGDDIQRLSHVFRARR